MSFPRTLAAVGITAGLALGAAACGSSNDDSSSSTTAASANQMPGTTMANSDAAMMTGLTATNFGPGCAAVPTSGPGSFEGMADAPTATAASANPALSTLVTAVKAAGLVDTLNGAGPFTVFAPTNDAFAKIDKATLDSVLADPNGALTKILTYHVIAGEKMDAEQLAAAKVVTTVEGGTVSVAKTGDTITVNGQSAVVCGNVQTANGTVQIIDTVLMPPS